MTCLTKRVPLRRRRDVATNWRLGVHGYTFRSAVQLSAQVNALLALFESFTIEDTEINDQKSKGAVQGERMQLLLCVKHHPNLNEIAW